MIIFFPHNWCLIVLYKSITVFYLTLFFSNKKTSEQWDCPVCFYICTLVKTFKDVAKNKHPFPARQWTWTVKCIFQGGTQSNRKSAWSYFSLLVLGSDVTLLEQGLGPESRVVIVFHNPVFQRNDLWLAMSLSQYAVKMGRQGHLAFLQGYLL